MELETTAQEGRWSGGEGWAQTKADVLFPLVVSGIPCLRLSLLSLLSRPWPAARRHRSRGFSRRPRFVVSAALICHCRLSSAANVKVAAALGRYSGGRRNQSQGASDFLLSGEYWHKNQPTSQLIRPQTGTIQCNLTPMINKRRVLGGV